MKPAEQGFSYLFLPLLGLFLLILVGRPCGISAGSGLSYVVTIEGVGDGELQRLLEEVSNTVALRKSPPLSVGLLRRRVNEDVPLLQKALRSEGFFAAQVRPEMDTGVDPIRVVFHIEPGTAFVLESVDIRVLSEGQALEEKRPGPQEIGLTPGTVAKSKKIVDAENRIIQWFRRHGFAFPKVTKTDVVVDHEAQAVSVIFHVQTGLLARFGATRIEGLASVEEGFVRGKIPWKEGDRFNADLLRETVTRIRATGLFATIQVRTGEAIDKTGHLPVFITLKERKHRTIKAGVSYKTDEGPGVKVSWEDRNLLGRGDVLNLSGIASGITLSGEGGFRKPEFLRTDQSLLLDFRIAEDRPEAYVSRNVSSSLGIERMLGKGMSLGAAVAFRLSKIDQLGVEERFSLFSLPTRFDWDTSDYLLDPTRGGRLHLGLAPYYDVYGADLGFVKGEARYSRYVQLSEKPFLLFASRGSLGTMAGAPTDSIPGDIRFYAGGGGSIRGYAFQTVGPLRDNEPVGGRSLLELSGEMRIKASDTLGFVAFLDGGSAFEATFPDFGETLRWGAGLGFRYFTFVGPLRLDVAVPLTRRDDIDAPFQIYVSLGQAF